jgi:hypothetical protein
MSFRSGRLWLTLNLVLIVKISLGNNAFFIFAFPVRYFRVPPGVRVSQGEDHCSEVCTWEGDTVWKRVQSE